MPLTPQEQSNAGAAAAPVLDLTDNAAKMSAVNDLLGLTAEETAKPEKAAPDTDTEAVQTVSEALAKAEKPNDSGESRPTVKPPKTLSELSEMTGFKVEDLYAIEIPAVADGGESHTFGKLKDLAASESDFAGRELQLRERTVEFGNDQAKARAELEIVLKSLPEGAIKPEVLAQARREREVMLDREAVRVLDVIPEWSNDDIKRADLVGIGEHMEQYGYEKGHVDQVADHRMLRYMRDNFKRMKLVEKALSGVKPVKQIPKSRASPPARTKQPIQATPASTQDEQLSAIDDLLKQG